MKKFEIEAEGGEIVITNSNGDYAVVPKNKVKEVEGMIEMGCHECVDAFVDSLPSMSDYAQLGTVVGDPPTTALIEEQTPVVTTLVEEKSPPPTLEEMYNFSTSQLKDLNPNDLYRLQQDVYAKQYAGNTFNHRTYQGGQFSYRLTDEQRSKWIQDRINQGNTQYLKSNVGDIYVGLNSDGTPNLESSSYYEYINKPIKPTEEDVRRWNERVNNAPTTTPPERFYIKPFSNERLDPNVYGRPHPQSQGDIKLNSYTELENQRLRYSTDDSAVKWRINSNYDRVILEKLSEDEVAEMQEKGQTPYEYARQKYPSLQVILDRR